MKYVIYAFIAIIAIALGFVYVKISSVNPQPVKVEEKIFKAFKKEELKKPLYFNLPARILYMKIDLRRLKKVIIYRITLNVNDKYTLFNIRVLLDNNNIAYSLLEDRKLIRIYVLFQSLKEAKSFFELFKKYDFNVNIEKIVKRI
ncbi:MAG: hypothetical protein GXO62_05350 [Epsilonproteobacteria bacterium]|nr:hypothetical protein [Campylobacterota bacterium]